MKARTIPAHIAAVVLAASLVFSVLGAAFAAEGLYDPKDVPSDIVVLSQTMSYDFTTHDFVYEIADSEIYVHASVADGMIVTKPVTITGAALQIYRNGERWDGDPASITEPGEYVVMGMYGNRTPRLFSFTLLGKTAGNVFSYYVPAGMVVTLATKDGEELGYDRYSVPMQADGSYHIEYECLSTGVAYTLDAVVDRTPPDVKFSGNIDERNRVHSALQFSGLKPDESLSVTLDGAPLEVTVKSDGTGELVQSGTYVIRAFDAAGNSSEYAYTVLIYLNTGGVAFILLLVAAVIAVAVYIIVKRRRLQIG